MSIIAKINKIECASGDLDTAVWALHGLADHMDETEDDTVYFGRFMANSFGAIRKRLQDGIEEAIKADRLKVVD